MHPKGLAEVSVHANAPTTELHVFVLIRYDIFGFEFLYHIIEILILPYRRPSAKILLESPYFPKTIKSSYLFLAPLQLVARDETRLRYAANLAKQGALEQMGAFATEMCATYCLPLIVNAVGDTEAEYAYILLKELMKFLTAQAVKTLLLPTIQKILQASC